MPLTIAERKHLMPRGAQREVVKETGFSSTYVSAVVCGEVRPKTPPARKKLRRAQVALARKLGRPVDDVFPPEIAHVEPARLAAAV
jgi:hypothetical protein